LKLIMKAVNGVTPDDLREIQPWPDQSKASMEELRQMSTEDLAARGYLLPPFHPHCRTICVMSSGPQAVRTEKPEVPEEDKFIPEQVATEDTFREVGMQVTPVQLDFWNSFIGLSPVLFLALWLGRDEKDILSNPQSEILDILPDTGEVVIAFSGVRDGARVRLQAVVDPLMGDLTITSLDSSAGSPEAQKQMLKNTFKAAIDTAASLGLDSVDIMPDDMLEYAKMGFVPSGPDWDVVREEAKKEISDGKLKAMYASLSQPDQLLLVHLLESTEPTAVTALVALNLYYDGKTVAQWVLEGKKVDRASLDMTNQDYVDLARESLV
jgi:hypothetical protein